jgi:hypothetical protein
MKEVDKMSRISKGIIGGLAALALGLSPIAGNTVSAQSNESWSRYSDSWSAQYHSEAELRSIVNLLKEKAGNSGSEAMPLYEYARPMDVAPHDAYERNQVDPSRDPKRVVIVRYKENVPMTISMPPAEEQLECTISFMPAGPSITYVYTDFASPGPEEVALGIGSNIGSILSAKDSYYGLRSRDGAPHMYDGWVCLNAAKDMLTR